MKINLLLLVSCLLLYPFEPVGAQDRSDYSTQGLSDIFSNINGTSSDYYFGKTYVFYNMGGMNSGVLRYVTFVLNGNNEISSEVVQTLDYNIDYDSDISSCVHGQDLFLFMINNEAGEMSYYMKENNGYGFGDEKIIHFPETSSHPISMVSYQDIIYMFFKDDADNYIKYRQLEYNDDAGELMYVNDNPTVLTTDHEGSGNVDAIKFIDNDMQEKIMIAFPGNTFSRSNNYIYFYAGVPGQFTYHSEKHSVNNNHCKWVSMAQGSVKGASTSSYNIQIGYSVDHNDNIGPVRCELNISDNNFSDWEEMNFGASIYYRTSWFMEFYKKEDNKRTKYLAQGYPYGSGAYCSFWESDQLTYEDQLSEVPPVSRKADFFDIILIVEGAVPYALNGYELGDPDFNNNPLTEFTFSKNEEHSVSTSTTYSLSAEMNMGIGPVTAGFKSSFQESSGTSETKSVTISNTINPPTSQLDSNGLMYYYYVAPTIIRSRWMMRDYNGSPILPERNVFFFKLTSPVLKTMSSDLSEYGNKTPRAWDLYSYQTHDLNNVEGAEVLFQNQTDINIKGGQTGSMELTFSNTETTSRSKSYDVSVGIDANYGIFSASATATAGLAYNNEQSTTYGNSFYFDWNLFAPVNPSDTNNIRKFSPRAFVLKTTESTAYYLPDSMTQFRPFFVGFMVSGIETGDFLYSIGENQGLLEQYQFNNYPNPCRDQTAFQFTLPTKEYVSLKVYDLYGSELMTVTEGVLSAGSYEYEASTQQLKQGVYFYRLSIGQDMIKAKLIVRK